MYLRLTSAELLRIDLLALEVREIQLDRRRVVRIWRANDEVRPELPQSLPRLGRPVVLGSVEQETSVLSPVGGLFIQDGAQPVQERNQDFAICVHLCECDVDLTGRIYRY